MAKGNSATSNQNFSFEKELLQRIRQSHPISSLSLPLALSSLFTSSLRLMSPFLPDTIAGGTDQLLRTVYDRLSWSDIGDYFSTLINEIGLGLNVSNISSRSGGGPMFSEPNLTNQYVYDMMLRIPGKKTEPADLLTEKISKEDEHTFEENTSVKKIDSKIDKNERYLRKQDRPSTKISIIKYIHNNDERYYHNYFPHPQSPVLPNNYNDYSIITSNFNSNYYDLLGQKENLGFNLQTLSRLSWSDIGDYFSTLINEIGLGLNVSNISSRSGGGPMFSEPNLTNQYVYDMMLRIPGKKTEPANLLTGKNIKRR